MSGQNWVKRGSLEGTGADITIHCGFKPYKVELFNTDDLCSAVKTEDMVDDRAFKRVTDGTATVPAGVLELSDTGFVIKPDADLNVAGETLHWVAYQAQND